MRRGFIGGNWKMNKLLKEAKETVENLNKSLTLSRGIDIVIFPPYTLLFFLKDLIDLPNMYLGAQNMHWEENGAFTGEISPLMLKDLIVLPNIYLGAQNMHWEENGAYTGEISPLMLKDLEVEYVIIGHSERRNLFNETDEIINKKTHISS